jgi:hypothetical protein
MVSTEMMPEPDTAEVSLADSEETLTDNTTAAEQPATADHVVPADEPDAAPSAVENPAVTPADDQSEAVSDPLPVESNTVAMGDIRSAFAFLDREGGGREGSVEPTWGNSSLSSSSAAREEACIEVNLVRNRLSIFERLSQQSGGGPPLPRQPATSRGSRAKSEARSERVTSPVSGSADRPVVAPADSEPASGRASFSERVRKISEQEAVIYEGMARNAAEEHEEGEAREEGGGVYPQKTQVQENVINEYTRKHSGGFMPSHSNPSVNLKNAASAHTTASNSSTQQAPVRSSYTIQSRVKSGHAQQSPTMENIQRSLGLTEAPAVDHRQPEAAADVRDTSAQPSPAATEETKRQPVCRPGVTYNLQKSGFSVTLKTRRVATAASPTDPAARKQVYNQYRELLKKFSHHREETV